ncbi:MAG: hypothetical protein AB1439_08550 [candidate division FCPU426 bacterium]
MGQKQFLLTIGLLFTLILPDVASGKEKLLVADKFSATINVIDVDSYQVIESVPNSVVGAQAMAVFRDDLYFVYSPYIDIYLKNSFTYQKTIEFDGFLTPGLSKIRITPDGKKMYLGLVGWGKEADSGIYIIDLVASKAEKVIDKNDITSGYLDISPDGKYLSYGKTGSLVVINTTDDTKAVALTLNLKKNEFVRDVVFGDGNLLYAILYYYPADSQKNDRLLIYDLVKRDQKTISLHEDAVRMFFGKDKYLYIACKKRFVKIDTAQMGIVQTIDISGGDICMTNDNIKIFISVPGDNEVVVIDSRDFKVLSKIKVGDEPYALLMYE